MINQIRQALEDQDATPVVMAYQPKVALSPGVVTPLVAGYEALLRWRAPDGSVLSPDLVIRQAAELGRDYEDMLFHMIIERVCLDIVKTPRDLRRPVAVNCSPCQVGASLALCITDALRHHGLDQGLIEIEITEHIPLEELATMPDRIRDLVNQKIPVWLDDFGAGYSCLGNLAMLPATGIKMDRSFMANGRCCSGRLILERMVSLCHELDLRVVLEGIENEHGHETAIETGSDFAQGYFYGRPSDRMGMSIVFDKRLAVA